MRCNIKVTVSVLSISMENCFDGNLTVTWNFLTAGLVKEGEVKRGVTVRSILVPCEMIG